MNAVGKKSKSKQSLLVTSLTWSLTLLIFFLLPISCGKKKSTEPDLNVDTVFQCEVIKANPNEGPAPLIVSFEGNANSGTFPYSYFWNFKDGSTTTGQKPTHRFTQKGQYEVALIVTDNEQLVCTSLTTINVFDEFSCEAISNKMNGLIPLEVSFEGLVTGGTSPFTYSWNFGDGGSSNNLNTQHTFTQPGIYNVVLSVTDSNSDIVKDTITITATNSGTNGGPLNCNAFAEPLTGSAPHTTHFKATPSGGTLPYTSMWIFNFDDTVYTTKTSYDYNRAGNYNATFVTIDAANNTCSKSFIIQVIDQSSSVICSADVTQNPNNALALNFTASASGGQPPYSYSWKFGDGQTSTEQNPIHTYSTDGDYNVELIVVDAVNVSCSKIISVIVTAPGSGISSCGATANPVTGDAPLTVNFKGNFIGGEPPYTYLWDFADGTTSNELSPTHVYPNVNPVGYGTTFRVEDKNGSYCETGVTVIVNKPPTTLSCNLTISPISGEIPFNSQFDGSATGGVPPYKYTYVVELNALSIHDTIPNQSLISHPFTQAGTYFVKFIVTDAINDTCFRVHTVHATATSTPIICNMSASPTSGTSPLTVSFSSTPSGGTPPYSFLWNFGDGGSSLLQILTHTYTFANSFIAQVTVKDSEGASKTETMTINASNPVSYTLTTSVVPTFGGGIIKSPNQTTYPAGTVVTLTADPSANYIFKNWTGDLSGTNVVTTITMNGNKNVTAVFESTVQSSPPTISAPATSEGTFTVTMNFNSWPFLIDGYERYELEESTSSPNFGFVKIDESAWGQRPTQYQTTLTKESGTYYYRCRVRHSMGYTEYSNVATVQVTAPSRQITLYNNSSTAVKMEEVVQFKVAPLHTQYTNADYLTNDGYESQCVYLPGESIPVGGSRVFQIDIEPPYNVYIGMGLWEMNSFFCGYSNPWFKNREVVDVNYNSFWVWVEVEVTDHNGNWDWTITGDYTYGTLVVTPAGNSAIEFQVTTYNPTP